MITETGSMSTEIVYSDDRKNRYLLRKTWGEGEKANIEVLLLLIHLCERPGFARANKCDICSRRYCYRITCHVGWRRKTA